VRGRHQVAIGFLMGFPGGELADEVDGNSNEVFMSHLLLRYSSIEGRLQLHVDGLVGVVFKF
jgi:hypothetical protein